MLERFGVEGLGGQIKAAGPSDRSGLGINLHVREKRGIFQRFEHAPPQTFSEVDIANGSDLERQP